MHDRELFSIFFVKRWIPNFRPLRVCFVDNQFSSDLIKNKWLFMRPGRR